MKKIVLISFLFSYFLFAHSQTPSIFGEQKKLDCNRLYNLELREKQAKVAELESKIKALELTNKINWKKIDEK